MSKTLFNHVFINLEQVIFLSCRDDALGERGYSFMSRNNSHQIGKANQIRRSFMNDQSIIFVIVYCVI